LSVRGVAVPESLTSTIASLEAAGDARRVARDSRLIRARFEILRVDILVTISGITKLSKGFSIPLREGTKVQGTIASQKGCQFERQRAFAIGSPLAPLLLGRSFALLQKFPH
jgi:hypothetical protein